MTVEKTRVQPEGLGESAEIDRRQIRRQVHLVLFETFRPVDGYGTLAKFDVSIAGLLTVKGVKLRKKADGPLRLVTARLERDGGFSVELRKWLRETIFEKAVTRLRGKLENDLAALDVVDVRADESYVPPADIPLVDAAALPEQLTRAVR